VAKNPGGATRRLPRILTIGMIAAASLAAGGAYWYSRPGSEPARAASPSRLAVPVSIARAGRQDVPV
jgi:hypothetical protein